MARILIIEDDDLIATELRSWLEKEGYIVDQVSTGKDGLLQLQRLEYELAVVEWQLPDMQGTEICRRISNSNLFLPIMMLGSRADVDDKIAALDSGAQDFLVNPCQLPELSARLRSLLRRYSRKKTDPFTVASPQPAVSTIQ